jgi:hypothetical protein
MKRRAWCNMKTKRQTTQNGRKAAAAAASVRRVQKNKPYRAKTEEENMKKCESQ